MDTRRVGAGSEDQRSRCFEYPNWVFSTQSIKRARMDKNLLHHQSPDYSRDFASYPTRKHWSRALQPPECFNDIPPSPNPLCVTIAGEIRVRQKESSSPAGSKTLAGVSCSFGDARDMGLRE